MAAVTFKPESALAYYGDTIWGGDNYWIGWVTGYTNPYSVRYTIKAPKKMKGFTAKISGSKTGSRDGRFIYQLSKTTDYPQSWRDVNEEGESYLRITCSDELEAGETYYLFVSKSPAGNRVWYAGCSAENVSITGETVGAGHVFRNGAWKAVEPKVRRGGGWNEITAAEYKGDWGELE